MSIKTFESLKLTLAKDRLPTVVTATGTSMDPIGFTQCTFSINGRSFTQKFIVCTNQTRPVILGKDFAARNCIGVIWTKQGSRKMMRTYVNSPGDSIAINRIPFSFTNLSMHSQYFGKVKVVGFAQSMTEEVEVHELADYDKIREMM